MNNKSKIIAFVVALFAVSLFGITQHTVNAASVDRTRDCDKYAVVYCGTMSEGELRDKYNQKDHAAVFKAFGISKSDISGDIRKGVVYRDGTVEVAGKTVATGATMAARHMGGSSISGSTTAKKTSVSKMNGAQEALVKFDKNGEFEWAVMTPCGNPVNATPKKTEKPVKPVYKCEALTAKKVGRNSYQFTTTASAKSGASIAGYSYDFGDGTTKTGGKTIRHTYEKPGTYTVSATVNVKVNGKTVKAPGDCETSVTVEQENCPIPGKEDLPKDSPKCKQDKPSITISKTVNETEHAQVAVNEEFTYEVVVENTGDVDLKNAVVTDKAPSQVTLLSASEGTVSGNTWKFTIAELKVGESKTFEITAKYGAYAGGKHVNNVCVDTPTIPGGPDDCDEASTEVPEKIKVCDTDTNEIVEISKDEFDASHMTTDVAKCDEPEEPEAPVELPKTGINESIMAVVGASSVVGAGAAYIASRRSI